jgi:CheY-like chemotaxis protein
VAQALAQFRLRAAQGGGAVNDEQEARLESELLGKIKAQKAPLPLLIVDDEAVYRNALASLIARSEDLSAKFLIRFAADAAEGVRLAEAEKPFLVILDVDLGAGSASGIDAVRTMREKGFAGRVCIHSNRFLADDYRTALEAGANTVLPKPMPRAHFLKVILEALEPLAAEAPSEPISRPEVVFIDDTEIFRMAWEIKLSRDTVFHGFDGARSFWRKVEQEPEFLSRLTCVITDYHFATGEFETGVQLGAKLKARGFAAPVLLASDGDFKLDDVRNGVDHVVPKGTLTWAELRPVVESIAIQSNTKET